MTRRYRLSSLAEADAAEIIEYVATQNLDAAHRLVDRFSAAFERIASHPGLGEKYETRTRTLRRTSVGDYLLFYQALDDGIVIYRILHGARNWQDLL